MPATGAAARGRVRIATRPTAISSDRLHRAIRQNRKHPARTIRSHPPDRPIPCPRALRARFLLAGARIPTIAHCAFICVKVNKPLRHGRLAHTVSSGGGAELGRVREEVASESECRTFAKIHVVDRAPRHPAPPRPRSANSKCRSRPGPRCVANPPSLLHPPIPHPDPASPDPASRRSRIPDRQSRYPHPRALRARSPRGGRTDSHHRTSPLASGLRLTNPCPPDPCPRPLPRTRGPGRRLQ
jgi:hypothetical protein